MTRLSPPARRRTGPALPLLALAAAAWPVLAHAQTMLTGSVADAASGAAIEFATVALVDASGGAPLDGTTSELDGSFALATDRALEGLALEVSFLGFEAARVPLAGFRESETVDVGTVQLAAAGQLLEEVTVRAERSQTTFELDKRVFNVGKDLASTGASALDVLDNVPSVNVDIEGNVTLRGQAGVQILINGKPSVLTSEGNQALSTLTADMIERIEVITNPSAKYEAEGTGGILNVVIKKDERRGLNGSVSVNGGLPANHSVGLSLNRRTERFNLFSQLGVGYREIPTDAIAENRNLATGSFVRSTGEEFRNEQFYNLVLGTDYSPSERDVITVSGNFAYEVEDQPSAFAFVRVDDPLSSVADRWRRTEDTEATNPKYQFDVQWVREFERPTAERPDGKSDKRDHQLLVSVTGSLFSKDQASLFANEIVDGDFNQPPRQRTRTAFGEVETLGKVDYTRPVGVTALVELGAQVVVNDVSNDFAVLNEQGGDFVVDPALTNVFEWDQRVAGVYATAAEQFGKLGLKGGLRGEYTNLETLLLTTGEPNSQDYVSLFPSAAASYELTDAVSFQASYGRRIDRPRLWDLNPFFNIRNNFNYRVGNPDLGPEFTDNVELTSIYVLGELSLNAGVYHARTTEVVERVTTVTAEDVAITRPVNVGTRDATGLEVNGKWSPAKAFTLRGDLNASTFSRVGTFEAQSFDFRGGQWSGRLSAKLKTPFELEAELTGRYRSGFETFQGRVSEQAWLDLGLRQPLWGGRGSLNASVRDVFASRVRESFVLQDDFEAYSFSQRGRFVTLGFSYGFGKGDAMEYLGQRRRW